MGIPVLTNNCCCFSLQTGTKIIAWIHLVVQAIVMVPIVLGMMFGLTAVSAIHEESSQISDDNPNANLVAIINAGAEIAGFLVAVIGTILILQFIATIYLLIGAHKEKPGHMSCWLIICLLYTVGAAGTMTTGGAVFCVINLYFICVVYSYYRQLKDNPKSSGLPALMVVDSHSVAPHVVTHCAPPSYYYDKK